jgi:hypothetical protein
VPRMKWWKLKEEVAKMFKERVLKKGPWHEGGDANGMWMRMATCIRKVASEEFRVTKGGKRETKETWWWNEKVQKAIKEKKGYLRRMHLDRSAGNVERYKVAKKTTMLAVCEAMSYPVFMPKSSTHHMHHPGSIVPHIRLKVFMNNQISRIKYNYYMNNVSKD